MLSGGNPLDYFLIHTTKGLDLIVTYSSPRQPGRVCAVIFFEKFSNILNKSMEIYDMY